MHETLRGRLIVLAGGGGGLGRACAELLHSEGARLLISYRGNAEHAAQAAAFGEVIQADLTAAEDRQHLLDAAAGFYGLVTLTGDPARAAAPEQMEEALRRSTDINLIGPLLLAREAAGRLRAAQVPGALVLVSTMQAMALFPGSTAYAAPKAALLHAARILAKECRGPANIRVNIISPGVMQAGMAEASIASGKYNRFVDEGAIPRFGRAADVARAVRFLLEPDNYITGQALTIDGGLTL